MARKNRIDVPDTVYHIYNRGHNKTAIFLDDLDRRTFLKYLKQASERCQWQTLGFCLMDNHFHLHVKTLDLPIGKTMHLLTTLYAGYFNFRYKRVGHVFQNRFHSIPVEVDSYLLTLSRYIHLNPVKAGMVQRPEDYEWSSYTNYVQGRIDSLIQPDLVLDTLCADKNRQASIYKAFVESAIDAPPEITEDMIRKQRVFGSEAFAKRLGEGLGTVPGRDDRLGRLGTVPSR